MILMTISNSPVIILILIFVGSVSAQTLSFSKNARTFETQTGSLTVKSLAYACLNLKTIEDDIPCNPAMVPEATGGQIKTFVLISNGYSNLTKIKRLMSNEFDQGLINDLFSEQRVLQTEATADLMFITKYINAKISPLTYKFFSVMRNDANPDVELVGVEQQEVVVQTGYKFENFNFGLEVKSTEWKFIHQNFKLLSLSTPEGAALLKPKSQTTVFVNPAVTYTIENSWSPRISVVMDNLVSTSAEFNEFQHPQEIKYGFSVTPPLSVGELNLLIDYKKLNADDTAEEKVHYGALYKYGAMNLSGGVDAHGGSVGIFYTLDVISSGILFSTTQLPWKDRDYFSQTVYVQIGWKL